MMEIRDFRGEGEQRDTECLLIKKNGSRYCLRFG